jgi:hypothetical protein
MYSAHLVPDHFTCVSSSDTIHACKPFLKLRGELVRKPFPVLLTHLVLETMENLKQTPINAANKPVTVAFNTHTSNETPPFWAAHNCFYKNIKMLPYLCFWIHII